MNGRVRVLQLIPAMHVGGAERVVQHLVRRLGDQFQMDVCCTVSAGALADELRAEGRTVVSLAEAGRYSVSWRIARLVRQGGYDILHSHGVSACIDAAPVRAMRQVRRFMHTFHFGNYPHIAKRYLYAQAVALRAADALVSVSNAQRDAIIEHLHAPPARISTIFNGVDDNPTARDPAQRIQVRSELAVDESVPLFGFVGTMTKQKGIPYLLDAARLLADRGVSFRLAIVGGGPLLDEMKGRSQALGLDGHVVFTGWRTDAGRLLSGFDAFVSSSLWEGFAMVLLEAMAAGKAIVATDVGDNRQAVVDGVTGLIVPSADATALADALVAMAADSRRREEFGNAGAVRYRERFTLSHMVDQYAETYRRLASR